jgi:hypothetical protein
MKETLNRKERRSKEKEDRIKVKKVRKIVIKKPTPEQYSNIKKLKNVEKLLRIARATKDPIAKKSLVEKAEKLATKYKKQQSWTHKLLKKS